MKIALCVESHGDETEQFVAYINNTTSHTATISRTNTDAVDGVALSCCVESVIQTVNALWAEYCA